MLRVRHRSSRLPSGCHARDAVQGSPHATASPPPFCFMGLKVTIEDAARRALKNQEPELLSTLRMLLSAIKNREIEKRTKGGDVVLKLVVLV